MKKMMIAAALAAALVGAAGGVNAFAAAGTESALLPSGSVHAYASEEGQGAYACSLSLSQEGCGTPELFEEGADAPSGEEDREEGVGAAVLVVTGTARVSAAADGCTFCGVIETVADDMNAASARNAEAAERVRAAFEGYGRAEEEYFSVHPMRGGYTAVRRLRFYAQGTERTEEMRSALADAGVTSLEGAVPCCSDESAHRAEALRLALQDAQSKAAQLGCTGGLVRAEELCCYAAFGPSAGGEVVFEATVRAVFARAPQPQEGRGNAPRPRTV